MNGPRPYRRLEWRIVVDPSFEIGRFHWCADRRTTGLEDPYDFAEGEEATEEQAIGAALAHVRKVTDRALKPGAARADRRS